MKEKILSLVLFPYFYLLLFETEYFAIFIAYFLDVRLYKKSLIFRHNKKASAHPQNVSFGSLVLNH